uniref:cell division protein FtsQ/DivIB n=1 Tax=Companilactobacillus versmoldensis TaxID=194326 RepID=UPI0002491EED
MSKKRKSYEKSFLIFIIAIIIITLAYFGSPLSKVKDITVKGVNDLGAQQVINATDISDNSLLVGVFFRQNSISDATRKKLPSVKSISFRTKNMRDLTINVKEYATLGLIYKNGYYYRIIDNGRILTNKLKSYTGNYPIYTNFNKKRELEKITKIYKKMPESVKKQCFGDP